MRFTIDETKGEIRLRCSAGVAREDAARLRGWPEILVLRREEVGGLPEYVDDLGERDLDRLAACVGMGLKRQRAAEAASAKPAPAKPKRSPEAKEVGDGTD